MGTRRHGGMAVTIGILSLVRTHYIFPTSLPLLACYIPFFMEPLPPPLQLSELHLYADFLRIVLEVINAVLTYALPRNPEVR